MEITTTVNPAMYHINRSGFSPRGRILFFLKSFPPGEIHDNRRDFFFPRYPGGGVYPGGYIHKFKPWSVHTDSSGECAMDNVDEQRSGQQGGRGLATKMTRGRRGAAGGIWLLLPRNTKGSAVSRVPAAFFNAEAGIRQERAQRA